MTAAAADKLVSVTGIIHHSLRPGQAPHEARSSVELGSGVTILVPTAVAKALTLKHRVDRPRVVRRPE